MQLLDQPPVDAAQRVLPQLLAAAGAFLCSATRFAAPCSLLRSVIFCGAPEFVCELGGRDRGVLLGQVRTQFRHVDIEVQLVEDGGHSCPCFLQVVVHRLRKTDAVKSFEQRLKIRSRRLCVHQHVIELLDEDSPEARGAALCQPAIVEERHDCPYDRDAQRTRVVGSRSDFGRLEDQQPIEPVFLVIEGAAERLYFGERSIERAFIFAKRATGC